MKRIFKVLCIVLFVSSCSAADMFPPSSFDDVMDIGDRKFVEFCLAQYDTDGDGLLSHDEAEEVRVLDCSSLGITSLYGIQMFSNLETLICDNNFLGALDLEGLYNLKYLSCKGNRITELDLREVTPEYVYCSPMDDAAGKNVLQVVYVYRDQDFMELDVPEGTLVISFPR